MVTIDVVTATSQTATSNHGTFTTGSYLRVVSATIVIYDYLVTLPSEFRLNKTMSRRSIGFILFVLIRYSSIILIIVNMIGFFYQHFSPQTCARYFYVGVIFKVIQVMESQAIMAIRTYHISLNNVQIRRVLISAYIVVTAYEWFSNVRHRIPVMTNGNCTVGTRDPDNAISSWSFYLAAMLFDLLVLSISTCYLLTARAIAGSTTSKLIKILLYDGLIYFVALTAVNIMNIILYRRGNDYQKIGAPLGFAITSIMSQRILLHAREAWADRTTASVSLQPTLTTIVSPVCADGETSQESRASASGTVTGNFPTGSNHLSNKFGIEVPIDKSMIGDPRQPDVGSIDRDRYATPRSLWELAQDDHV